MVRFSIIKWSIFHLTNTPICNAKMKVNNMLVFAYGYDEVADMMYQNIKENDIELIYGRLDSEGKIEVFEFEEYKML